MIHEFADYNTRIDVYDPWVNASEASREYSISLIKEPLLGAYDGVVVAVAHEQFKALGTQGIGAFCIPITVVYDLKYVLPRNSEVLRL